MTYKQYGPVLVVSSLCLTGKLWYDRLTPSVRGQDVAACMAVPLERAFGMASGTNVFVWGSNVVGLAASFADLYGAAGHLRTLMQGSNGVAWLDYTIALPADHGIVSLAAGQAWAQVGDTETDDYGRDLRHYAFSDPSSATPYFLTMDTRYPDGTLPARLHNGLAATNVPAVAWFYDTIPDPGYASFFWGTVGNWWAAHGLGTNLYLWPHMERATTNAAIKYNKSLHRDSLDDIRTVALATRSTVRVFEPSEFADHFHSLTGAVTVSGSAYTNQASYMGSQVPIAAMIADAVSTAVSGQTVVTNAAIPAVLAWVRLGGEAVKEVYFDELDNREEWEHASDGLADFSKTKGYGFACDYPHPDACASGLVSRIRIYAVASGAPAFKLDPIGDEVMGHAFDTTYSSNRTATADTLPNTWYAESYDLGTGLDLGEVVFVDSYKNITRYDDVDPSLSGWGFSPPHGPFVQPYIYYWTMIADVSNPTASPIFDIGTELDISTLGTQQSTYLKGYHPGVPDEYAEVTRAYFYQEVRLDRIVVIADWRFRHMGLGSYTPETNAPAWSGL